MLRSLHLPAARCGRAGRFRTEGCGCRGPQPRQLSTAFSWLTLRTGVPKFRFPSAFTYLAPLQPSAQGVEKSSFSLPSPGRWSTDLGCRRQPGASKALLDLGDRGLGRGACFGPGDRVRERERGDQIFVSHSPCTQKNIGWATQPGDVNPSPCPEREREREMQRRTHLKRWPQEPSILLYSAIRLPIRAPKMSAGPEPARARHLRWLPMG